MRSEVLFVAGRAGVGKSTVGAEIHEQLSAADVRHAVIEGDNLDLAHPPPQEHLLAERNLAEMWVNYRSAGYSRLVYTNTASVLATVDLVAAMGDDPRVVGVLLTASDETARERLGRRERGSGLDWHVQRSDLMARRLEADAPAWVHRVDTDARTVRDIAAGIIDLTGWSAGT